MVASGGGHGRDEQRGKRRVTSAVGTRLAPTGPNAPNRATINQQLSSKTTTPIAKLTFLACHLVRGPFFYNV